jgi:uncharacterized protein (TIGR03437 family)
LLKFRFVPFLFALALHAQTVRFMTTMGGIDVTLTPNLTPKTVANFMDYVNSGFYASGYISTGGAQYSGTIISGSSNPNATTPIPPYTVQGGGYALAGVLPQLISPTFPPVDSEFANLKCPCNIAGTLATALSANGVDSAQNQWFFNTQDNTSTLDTQSSTIFGNVANSASLAVLKAINQVPTFAYDAGEDANFTTLPLVNYSCPNMNCPAVKPDNFVYTFSVAPLAPTVTGVADSASALNAVNTGISPGEILTLYGSNLGPCQASAPLLTATCASSVITTLALNSAGTAVTTLLEGTEVTFNGIPGPMVFTLDGQIAVIAPYGISGSENVTVVVSYLGVQTNSMQFKVVPATPGLYALNEYGTGDAAILRLNSDGTVSGISTSSPASVGDLLEIYGEGYGVATPSTSLPDGAVVTTVLPKPASSTAVLIDGQQVSAGNIQYLGGAGGDVNGVMQINLIVPKLAPGPHSIQVQVGSAVSRTGVNLQTK